LACASRSGHFLRPFCQEVTGREAEDEGRIPRTLEAELRGELVDGAAVGDVVRVLGCVKVLNADAAAGEGLPAHHFASALLDCS
jgi:DNA replicative helicase MCM subunit Mcm2 (Cdc46/Mcm family)